MDHRLRQKLSIDAHEVYDRIYVGSLPMPGSSYEQAGVHTIVLCAREYQGHKNGDFGNVRVLHCPLDDDGTPMSNADIRRALSIATDVARTSLHGKKVLVTCFAGVNRSALVAGLSIYARSSIQPNIIVDIIRTARRPPSGHKPLCNKEFVRILESAPTLFAKR